MNNSNKSTIFTFGKLENLEDSEFEKSPSDEDYVSKNPGSNTNAAQSCQRFGFHPEGRSLSGQSQILRGHWILICDDKIKNSDGLTEADITWAAVNRLHEKEADIFTFRQKKFFSKDFANISCYTADYRDEEFILKVAKLLRENVDFPYVMYYYPTNWKYSIYMHTPNGEFYTRRNKRWLLLDKK